ncbi:MAG: hypothetical protein ACD_58C00120G0003 [uncultured bacterium]|nr:MAG: hypothetical protein ACD_58C00120G0003 [uncultured bacterium]
MKNKNQTGRYDLITILLLIFFWPAGLYLMWNYTQWNSKLKIVLTILIVAITIWRIWLLFV